MQVSEFAYPYSLFTRYVQPQSRFWIGYLSTLLRSQLFMTIQADQEKWAVICCVSPIQETPPLKTFNSQFRPQSDKQPWSTLSTLYNLYLYFIVSCFNLSQSTEVNDVVLCSTEVEKASVKSQSRVLSRLRPERVFSKCVLQLVSESLQISHCVMEDVDYEIHKLHLT